MTPGQEKESLKTSTQVQPESDRRERRFYNQIATISNEGTLSDKLHSLCEVWCECMDCEWVWLWQYNEHSSHWEIFGYASRSDDCPLPPSLFLGGEDSVCGYCSLIQKPILVPNVELWQEAFKGRNYSVKLSSFLKDHKCPSLISIPIDRKSNPASVDGNASIVNRVICCHFSAPEQLYNHQIDVLLTKALLSFFFITTSYVSHQRSLFERMDQIALEHIEKSETNPRENRIHYTRQLIRLIQDQLGIEGCSVFLADTSSTVLECVSTTGIYDIQNNRYEDGQLDHVFYERGESRTWQTFATNKVSIGSIIPRSEYKHEPRFQENPRDTAPNSIPWVIHPISYDSTVGGPTPVRLPIGVIRCTGHPVAATATKHRNYLPVEIQTLSLIAKHSSIMFSMLNSAVNRETQIATVKHDLLAPLLMVRDASRSALIPLNQLSRLALPAMRNDKASEEFDRAFRQLDNSINDMSVAGLFATLMITVLDRDPAEKLSIHPEVAELGGEVIAPLKGALRHYAVATRQMEIIFTDFNRIPPLFVDKVHISRVFSNLIINAIKYGRRGTRILVVGFHARENRQIVFSVTNEGDGVEDSDAGKIFQGLYRSEHAKAVATGDGWGLKISKKIMVLHEGDLVLTQCRNPTIFSMILPRSLIRSS